MAVAIDKAMRERAKQDDKYLFQVSLDPKYLSAATKKRFRGKAPTTVHVSMSGPLGPKEAAELWRLLRKWQERELV
jgi:hypothetical protein